MTSLTHQHVCLKGWQISGSDHCRSRKEVWFSLLPASLVSFHFILYGGGIDRDMRMYGVMQRRCVATLTNVHWTNAYRSDCCPLFHKKKVLVSFSLFAGEFRSVRSEIFDGDFMISPYFFWDNHMVATTNDITKYTPTSIHSLDKVFILIPRGGPPWTKRDIPRYRFIFRFSKS